MTQGRTTGGDYIWQSVLLQAELLNGQKLQGVLSSNEVQSVLKLRGWEEDYPLMSVINGIVQEILPPDAIFRFTEAAKLLHH